MGIQTLLMRSLLREPTRVERVSNACVFILTLGVLIRRTRGDTNPLDEVPVTRAN